MFFILNKPKIYSYLVVLSTVLVLFFTAAVLTETKNIETEETSAESTSQEKPIDKINTDKKRVAITIDCLDTEKNIEEILKTLENKSIKVTFCIYGEWVKKYPELTLRINHEGHNIVNMADIYQDMSEMSYEDISKNMKEGENKLSSLLNKEIKIFKCPYGKYNENIMNVANKNSYIVIGYDINTLDYQGLEADVIWNNIKNKITNGSIIAMNSNAEHIIEEINLISESIKERQYEIVTVKELIDW